MIELTSIVDRAKAQLKLEPDEDAVELDGFAAAAVLAFQHKTGCVLFPAGADLSQEGNAAVELTEDILLGCLMLVAHWYENREAVSDVDFKKVPLSLDYLWAPYILEVI